MVLVTIGFILALHSAAFSVVSFLFQKQVLSDVLLKILIVVLAYNVASVIFMIVGWNELRLFLSTDTTHWSYAMLIVGYSFGVLSIIPITFSILITYGIQFDKNNQITNVK